MAASHDDSHGWRELAPVLLLFLPAAWLGTVSEAPVLSIALWWSLTSAPAGVLAAAVRGRRAVWSLVGWAGVALWLLSVPSGVLPSAPQGVAACAALYLFGYALAHGLRCSSVACAGMLWLAAGLLAALPSGAGALARPWPPGLTADLLDLSPQVWVLEVAGFDWLRHPAVYERAGGADLGPDLRVPWQASSALWALGAALALAALSRRRMPMTAP